MYRKKKDESYSNLPNFSQIRGTEKEDRTGSKNANYD